MADRPETVTGLPLQVAKLQERTQNAAERNRGPFEGGREVKYEFDLDAGTVTVRRIHGLGRKPKGFIITDLESNNVLDAVSFLRADSSKNFLEIQAVNPNGTGFYKLTVWVY